MPRWTQKAKHDMFGRTADASPTSPGPVASPPDRGSDQLPDEPRQAPIAPRLWWGNQANFGLAGPPGKLQMLIADLWTQWWRPWALVGILVLGLVIVGIVNAL